MCSRLTRTLFTILFGLSALSPGQVVITEFLASNDSGIEDENGDRKDWIELHNTGSALVDLDGWSLTDKADNSQKWIFPAVTMAPGEFLVVFASNKDRSVPGLPLHTNFSLSKGGEYLALFEPGGSIAATEFAPSFPPQAPDVSFGPQQGISEETAVPLNASGRAGVPTSLANFNSQFSGWNTSLNGSFTGNRWQAVTFGAGYETNTGGVPYGSWLSTGGDIEALMHNQNASAFFRIPFSIANPSEVTSASLRMRWDDGFVAYLNGDEIAEHRKPANLSWDSASDGIRIEELNEELTNFPIDLGNASFNGGDNLLAIHGLNQTAGSSDFLIQAELVLTRLASSGAHSYFTTPSPGSANGSGSVDLAPLFEEITESAPTQPTGSPTSPNLLVTATVREGTDSVATVTAFYRTMFAAESSLILLDDGIAPDALAADGIYSGEIPTSQISPGEMLRWRFEAVDSSNNARTSPPYNDPLDSDRYYGTVALDPDLTTSNLPVIQLFVENAAAVDTSGGDRISVSYLGEFYDNVQMDLHGQTSLSFPKKSYDLDFNRGNRFTWKEGEIKAKDINLLSNWADKSKVRNTFAYDSYKQVGNPYHYAFPVRVERNGSFFAISDLVEDGDDRFLERLGMDPDGALYKMYDPMQNVNTANKKTRKDEGRQDLQDFFNQMSQSNSTTTRRRNAYDYLDVAGTVNQLVANAIIGVNDTGLKNYYLYRDTEGTEEWRPLPWDVDLSAGHRWGGPSLQYFDDSLQTPLLLDNFNSLWQLIYTTTEFKEMYARRFETLRREFLQPNGTPIAEDWVRKKIIEIEVSTNPPGVVSDSDLDYTAWGSWGDNLASLPYSMRLYNEWLPGHRSAMFSANINGTPIPPTQPSIPNIVIDSIDFLPNSGNQDEEYLIIKNNESSSLDLTGWTLSGAVDYTFPAGTVVLAGSGTIGSNYKGLIHVARSPADFRSRSTGPTGGEFRFVQGPYDGQLSARGEMIVLRNAAGTFVDEYTYPGAPTDAQRYLRISEINYNPANPTPAELLIQPGLEDRDFEFIELMNTGPNTLDLSGASFTLGIDYTFPASTDLAANDRLLLVKNPTAFDIRYGDPGVVVLGPYSGLLENLGETLKLEDPIGENILEFTYLDSWYPNSDGSGSSLVLRDIAADYDEYSNPATWGSSPELNGSPGLVGSGYETHFNGWQAINFSLADQLLGMPGHPDSDVDGDGLTTWDEYALGTNENVPNDFPSCLQFFGTGATQQLGLQTTRRRFTSDVQWQLFAGPSLPNLDATPTPAEENLTVLSSELESVLILDPAFISTTPKQFYQLRISALELP
ncbi:MAG: lamin tail domain-containing protein [Roseibacillus sp.]